MYELQLSHAGARRVLICLNPKAGSNLRNDRVAELRQGLEASGFEVEVGTDLERLASLANELTRRRELRALVAAGGDGTAAALVHRTSSDIPLALLPLGTENILSKYIGQGRSPQQACQLICDGHAVRLDAGRAGGRLFLLMFTAGFDAEVVRRMHQQRLGHISHWSWAKPIWQTVRSYVYPPLRVYGAAQYEAFAAQPQTAHWVLAANLPRYAVGLHFIPDACGTDRLLDVFLFQGKSLYDNLRLLSRVALRRRKSASHDDCVAKYQRIRVESDVPVAYQVDGDCGGMLPVEVEVLPQRFTLLVPRRFAERLDRPELPAWRSLFSRFRRSIARR